jgi:hypothetical protein
MSHEEPIDITASGAAEGSQIESIWLTKPSIKPIVLAASLMFALVGLFGFRPLMFAAIVVAVITTLSWIAESRRESDELPLS